MTQNNGVKCVYLLPLNSLFVTHCLHTLFVDSYVIMFIRIRNGLMKMQQTCTQHNTV